MHLRRNRFSQGNRSRSFSPRRPNAGRSNGNRFIKAFNPSSLVQKVEAVTIAPIYEPKHKFSDFQVSEVIKKNLTLKQYDLPTPIQDQAIPHIIAGADVIGIANTGTGKTAAFLIPLIDKVINDRSRKALIIAPTRELAVQIRDELYDFSRNLGINTVLCIGGSPLFRQRNALRGSFNFVIGTPGRLKDLVQTKDLRLSQFNLVVLDEADQMMDIGFFPVIKQLITMLPQARQSLFFSATIDDKVREIIRAFVKDPVTISVKKQDTAINIEQDIIKIDNNKTKVEQLHSLLIQKNYDKVLIFGRTKWGVQRLSDELVKRGFKAGAIHGNKTQGQRLRTLGEFKQNRLQILIATDVASRGLDIENVSHVINYDMPATYEDYIHRIGRTGRANKKGTALTFVG